RLDQGSARTGRAPVGLPRQSRPVRHHRSRSDPGMPGPHGRCSHDSGHHGWRMPGPDLLRFRSVAKVQENEYPEHLYYDIENQICYEPLHDGTIRVGMTPIAVALAGEILVFTPKRIGREFESARSFATLEGGKWVGSARAAFDGSVVAYNEALVARPGLLSEDAFGTGWMLLVRWMHVDWRPGLVTGTEVGQAFSD